jgi:hypothetical protein
VLIYLVNNEKIERKKSRKLKRENIKRVGYFFTRSQINALLRENFITHCWYWQIAFKCDSFSLSYFAEEESLSLSFEFFNYSKECQVQCLDIYEFFFSFFDKLREHRALIWPFMRSFLDKLKEHRTLKSLWTFQLDWHPKMTNHLLY